MQFLDSLHKSFCHFTYSERKEGKSSRYVIQDIKLTQNFKIDKALQYEKI